jgi:hypothetical protein
MSVHIYQQATVLTEQGSLDLARILYTNHLDAVRNTPAPSVSASTEASGFPADAVQRPDTYEFWKPTAISAWVRASFGSAKSFNAVGIAAHTLGSSACNVKAQHSANGSVWSDASDVFAPSDDTAILLLFPQVSNSWFRLLIDSQQSPSGSTMPTIGSIYVGNVLVMQRPVYSGVSPITLSRDTMLQRALSDGGQFVGQNIRRVGYKAALSFRHLTSAWYRANFDPFVEAARQYPFFCAWRPSDFPNENVYAWCTDDIAPSNMGIQSYMQVSFKIFGYGNE